MIFLQHQLQITSKSHSNKVHLLEAEAKVAAVAVEVPSHVVVVLVLLPAVLQRRSENLVQQASFLRILIQVYMHNFTSKLNTFIMPGCPA